MQLSILTSSAHLFCSYKLCFCRPSTQESETSVQLPHVGGACEPTPRRYAPQIFHVAKSALKHDRQSASRVTSGAEKGSPCSQRNLSSQTRCTSPSRRSGWSQSDKSQKTMHQRTCICGLRWPQSSANRSQRPFDP